MIKIKLFIRTSLLGGLVVLLPIGILMWAFRWVFGFLTSLIQPLTDLVLSQSHLETKSTIASFIAIASVLATLLSICFIVGVIVRFQVGRFIHEKLETHIFRLAPGYKLIKETVLQFLGNRPSPFSSVALVRIFGNETIVTAFVTERHDNGMCTVFVPTGPNPTSGNIYHLKPEFVQHVDQTVEDVMRSIISCGAGSKPLLSSLERS